MMLQTRRQLDRHALCVDLQCAPKKGAQQICSKRIFHLHGCTSRHFLSDELRKRPRHYPTTPLPHHTPPRHYPTTPPTLLYSLPYSHFPTFLHEDVLYFIYFNNYYYARHSVSNPSAGPALCAATQRRRNKKIV